MWGLIPLLLIPILVMLVFRYGLGQAKNFTAKEFVLLEVGVSILLGIGFMVAREAGMADHELWSGRISDKDKGTQSCCHCTQVCDTCTDSQGRTSSCNCRETCSHSRDYWWSLDVSTGDTISVDNCSPSSSDPEVWTNARIGEPAVVEHYFRNYLKADPDSVLHQDAAITGNAPNYPEVYGLYRVNRAINLGTQMDANQWSRQLDEVLADLGGQKLVNIVVVATTNPNPAFAQVIERDWLYGKLNDAIFVLGAPDGVNVTWAAVVTMPTGNTSLHVTARDELVGLSLVTPETSIAKITALVSSDWKWSGVEDLAYLAWAASPPTWLLVVLYVVAVIISVIGSMYMIAKDVFNENPMSRFNNYRNRRF